MNNKPVSLIEENCHFFLQKLRISTQPMHKKLEESRLSVNLMKCDISLAEYAEYLAHMKNVISYHEYFTFPVVEYMFPNIHARHRLLLINHDIEWLQQSSTINPYNVYEINTSMPLNVPRALGYMYVIEGSTLGGQMILKHIKMVLGFDEHKGALFFGGYGNETGKRWKEFLDIFAKYAVAECCEDEIISGAIDAFKSIQTHFA